MDSTAKIMGGFGFIYLLVGKLQEMSAVLWLVQRNPPKAVFLGLLRKAYLLWQPLVLGPEAFSAKSEKEQSVASACNMAACGRECVTFGGKTVIVTPELKLFPRTFTRKGLPHSEFKSRLDGHRRPISGPARAGLRPFLRPIPGINYCSLSGRCLWAWELECWRLHGAQCTGRIPPIPGVGDGPGTRWPVDGELSINTRDFKQHVSR